MCQTYTESGCTRYTKINEGITVCSLAHSARSLSMTLSGVLLLQDLSNVIEWNNFNEY